MGCIRSVLRPIVCIVLTLGFVSAQLHAQSSNGAAKTNQLQFGEGQLTWPREFTDSKGNQLVLYQPQIDEWKDYQILDGRQAAAFTAKGSKT